MRKRAKFKKVLALLLAVAMVSTTNTAVFAEDVVVPPSTDSLESSDIFGGGSSGAAEFGGAGDTVIPTDTPAPAEGTDTPIPEGTTETPAPTEPEEPGITAAPENTDEIILPADTDESQVLLTSGDDLTTGEVVEISTADEFKAAVAAGGAYKLIRPIDISGWDLNKVITSAKNVELDLNQQTLSFSGTDYWQIKEESNVKVMNGTISSSTVTGHGVQISGNSSLVLENVAVSSNKENGNLLLLSSGSLELSGSTSVTKSITVGSSSPATINVKNSAEVAEIVAALNPAPNTCNVNISGGTVGKISADIANAGTMLCLNISGGTIGDIDLIDHDNDNSQSTIVNIIGGTFNNITSLGSVQEESSVTGGTFKSESAKRAVADLLSDGKILDENGTVTEAPNYVAQVGENKYETLAAAFNAAANTTASIKLLKDTEEIVTVSSGDITLDLNGYQIISNQAVENGFIGTITVKGGKLTLNDESATGTGKVLGGMFAVVVQGGELIVNSGTYGSCEAPCDWYEPLFIGGGTGVINGGTFVDGSVEYYLVYSESGSLTVNGGRFDSLPYFVESNKGASIWAPDENGYITAYATYAEFANANSSSFSYDSTTNVLRMIGDYEATIAMPGDMGGIFFNGNVTLDLAGHTWSLSNENLIVINGGVEVTLRDSGERGTIVNRSNMCAIETMGVLNLQGGTLQCDKYSAVIVDGNSTVNMSGGKIIAGSAGITISGPSSGTAGTKQTINISGGTILSSSIGCINITEDSTACTITGGTFSSDVSKYVPADYKAILDENGSYVVTSNYAASVTDTSGETVNFGTLKDAIAAVIDGNPTTITLLSSVNENVTINVGQNITLDLNGKTLAAGLQEPGRHYYAIKNHGTLTLQDTSDDKAGCITARGVENYGTMYMQSGTIDSCDSNGGGAAIWNEGTLEMTGGTLKFTGVKSGNNAGSPLVNGKSGAVATISGGSLESPYTCLFVNAGTVNVENISLQSETEYWMTVKVAGAAGTLNMKNVTINATKGGCLENAGGTVTLENCAFTQSSVGSPAYVSSAVAVSNGGTITVKSGTYKADGFGAYVFNSGGTINIEGGTFEAPTVLKADDSVSSLYSSTINVSGGSFDGKYAIGDHSTLEISGGTFSTEVPDQYCAEGFRPKDNGDGTYTVEKAYAASIGEQKYMSLADAVSAAKDGDTVNLLANVKDIGALSINRSITLEGNGNTISGNSSVYANKDCDITINNVKFSHITNEKKSLSAIYGSGLANKLTITNCEFDNIDWDAIQITPVTGAEINITGNTFSDDQEDGIMQQRYIHIQADGKTETKIKAVVTDNILLGQKIKNGSTGIYFFSADSDVRFSGNYVENFDLVSIASGTWSNTVNANNLIFPARSQKDVDVDDLNMAAEVVKDAYNSAFYSTLQEAADAVTSGENPTTITLLNNVSENVTIKAGQNITLDLNGKTLNGGTVSQKAAITNNGILTIKDSSAADGSTVGEGTIKREDTGTRGYYVIVNNGTMTFESGYVYNGTGAPIVWGGSSLICNGAIKESIMNVNGGKFEQGDFIVFKNDDYGTLNINGGTVVSNTQAVQNWHIAAIAGGDLKGDVSTCAYNACAGKTVIKDGTVIDGNVWAYWFNDESQYPAKEAPVITIRGGKITGGLTKRSTSNGSSATIEEPANERAVIAVSGGIFYEAVEEDYCAEGYIPKENENGTYTVEVAQPVASVGEVKYASLEDAVSAVKPGETITLLSDVTPEENEPIRIYDKGTETEPITFDLNGHNIIGSNRNVYLDYEVGTSNLPGGILRIFGSHVTLTDSSEGDKGSIVNNSYDKAYGLAIGSSKANSCTVTITGGVNFNVLNSTALSAAVCVNKNAELTIENANLCSTKGRAIFLVSKDGKVCLNGGTYYSGNAKYADVNEYCPEGKEAVQNEDGIYTVGIGHYDVVLYSSLADGQVTSIATLTGGAKDIEYDTSHTVTATGMSGYKFAGWYEASEVKTENGTTTVTFSGDPVSRNASYNFQVKKDTTLVAVYEATKMVTLHVDGSNFKVNGKRQPSGYHKDYAVGTEITLEYAGTDKICYWKNGSDKIVSRAVKYTFSIVADTDIRLVVTTIDSEEVVKSAYVEFVSVYDQVMQAEMWYSDDEVTDHVLPAGPSKFGGTFQFWSLDGTTEATVKSILEAVQSCTEERITVIPVYKSTGKTYEVKVIYPDGTEELYENLEEGIGQTVTAKDITGKTFVYWSDAESDGAILSYSTEYFVRVSKDITLYAIYDTEEVEKAPTIIMSNKYARVDGGKNKISFEVTRDIPDEYTLIEHGVLYGSSDIFGQPDGADVMVLDGEGVRKMTSKDTARKGIYTLNINMSSTTKRAYARGYMVLKNADGIIENYYTAIESATFAELQNNS